MISYKAKEGCKNLGNWIPKEEEKKIVNLNDNDRLTELDAKMTHDILTPDEMREYERIVKGKDV